MIEGSRTSIDFGSQHDCERYLVSGWSHLEAGFVWSEGRRSVLRIDKAAGNVACRLQIELRPFLSPSTPVQTLTLRANGSVLVSQAVRERTTLSMHVPAGILAMSDTLELSLDCPTPGRPIDGETQSSDRRWLGFALERIALTPIDGGQQPTSGLPANLLSETDGRAIARAEEERTADIRAASERIASFASGGDLAGLLDAYLDNTGAMGDERALLLQTIVDACDQGRVGVEDVKRLGALNKAVVGIVERLLPHRRDMVFDYGSEGVAKTTILFAEGENPFHDPVLASSMVAFGQKRRAGLDLRSLDGGLAYVHPYCSFVCTSDGRFSMTDANIKAMTRPALTAPRVAVDRPIVIVQDFYNGGNIAHFLFEHVTRLFHACDARPDLRETALFVFGGLPTDFHRIVLSATAELLGLRLDQFLFPGEARLLQAPDIVWFSDQVQRIHPAQGMHPVSLSFLDRLARHLDLPTGTRRLYISRADAGHRRLANEAQLFAALAPLGFEMVRLAEHPASEQMRLVAAAGLVVAPHGMGETHLAFNRGRPRLIEILHPTLASASYALLAKARGWRYDHIIGQTSAGPANPYEVDIAAFMQLLGAVPTAG